MTIRRISKLLGASTAALLLASAGSAQAGEDTFGDLVAPYPFVESTPAEQSATTEAAKTGSASGLPDSQEQEHEAWVHSIWTSP